MTKKNSPPAQRKVVDARADDKGNITHVKLEGNRNFTPAKRAINMAERGELENAHSVTQADGTKYLRTNPDSKIGNNLDTMAGDLP